MALMGDVQIANELRLPATDGALWLTLIASELAFNRVGLHSISAGSHKLQLTLRPHERFATLHAV
jgi:hypothetical protein